MIRRDIRLADGSAGWMLISQVEHARVSAQLAQNCAGPFIPQQRTGSSTPPAPSALLVEIRAEVLAAIAHHDDGWAEWERAPQLDPATGRPLAFIELDHIDAISIWSRSIDAAKAIGLLAGWIVAGHFLRLVRKSMQAGRCDAVVESWSVQTVRRRAAWIAAWEMIDLKHHTPVIANEALQWLWTFDEASLWLCCSPSSADHQIPCAPEPYCAGRGTPVEMELQAIGPELAAAQPWRFDVSELSVTGAGRVVPIRRYRSPAELLAAAAPQEFHWRLIPEENRGETPPKPRS